MILKRLNMDTTWLLQLGKFRLLVDPWLKGVEVDYAPWFNKQWHRTAPTRVTEVEEFDAVLVTQKYADHCHIPTLRDLSPPHILAPKSLRRKLERWMPQASVRYFDANRDALVLGTMEIQRLPNHHRFGPTYDSYLISSDAESILIANHGLTINNEILDIFDNKRPNVLLSPFNLYRLPRLVGGLVSPGLPALKELVEALRPRFVIATHDEDKHARGLIPTLSKVNVFDHQMVDKFPWLEGRYLNISDYNPVSL